MNRVPRMAALGLIGWACALSAQASSIQFQSRFSTAGAAPAGSLSDWGAYYQGTLDALTAAAPGAGYCDATPALFNGVSNQASCGGTNANLALHIQVEFTLAAPVTGFSMQFGPDFGRGGAFFLNGSVLDARNTDMWWNGSLADPSQHFEAMGLSLAAGTHRVDLYGLEGCCDGGQVGRFQLAPTAGWQFFGRDDGLNPAPVPTPASLPLALLGLLLLPALRPRAR